MTVNERANTFLDEMFTAPRLWASSKESFVNRALTILEMTGIRDDSFFMDSLTIPGKTPNESMKFVHDSFSDEWARVIIIKAKNILKANNV